MGHFFLVSSSLATDRETSRRERCHFSCLHLKIQTHVRPSKSFPQASVLTLPKAPAQENPLRTATVMERGRQRAPQSSAACPLQGPRLCRLGRAWGVTSPLERVVFRICRHLGVVLFSWGFLKCKLIIK